jgi:probable rRNA maturation factor
MASDPPANDIEVDLSLVEEAPAPPDVREENLLALAAFVLQEEGANGQWEVAVALVDDARLQALHRDFMGDEAPTDVMTFPYEASKPRVNGGDIIISVDHARRDAAIWNHSPAEEVAFLVAHGLLHLLGWRDETPDGRDAMLARQQSLFDRFRAHQAASGERGAP